MQLDLFQQKKRDDRLEKLQAKLRRIQQEADALPPKQKYLFTRGDRYDQVECPSCDRKKHVVTILHGSMMEVECMNCGLVHLVERPVAKAA